jgi:hypothetical protein
MFSQDVKSIAWIFPLYFQLPYLPEETCFQQGGGPSVVEGTSQPACHYLIYKVT